MAKYTVNILDTAGEDLKEIKSYLNRNASPKVRKAFAGQLDKQLSLTENFPDAGAVYQKNPEYQRLVVHKYPYCAYYKVDHENKTIDVYRILHTSRDVERIMSQEKALDQDTEM